MNTELNLRPEQAAEYLEGKNTPCSVATLATLRTRGGGPKFRKFGRMILYTPKSLDEWVESRLSDPVASTSEYAEQRRQG